MRLRAIVIDDEPLRRRLLMAVFTQRQYEVFTFLDPNFCPLHVAHRCPCPSGILCADVIVSELRTPSLNGLDFLEALMEKGCLKPHFAVISSQWTEAEVERARQLDCKVFLKPFHINAITQWLDEIEPFISPDRQLINWNEHDWSNMESKPNGKK